MKYFVFPPKDESLDQQYKRLARIHNPDKGGDVVAFQALQNEYDGLKKKKTVIPAIPKTYYIYIPLEYVWHHKIYEYNLPDNKIVSLDLKTHIVSLDNITKPFKKGFVEFPPYNFIIWFPGYNGLTYDNDVFKFSMKIPLKKALLDLNEDLDLFGTIIRLKEKQFKNFTKVSTYNVEGRVLKIQFKVELPSGDELAEFRELSIK